MLPVDLSFDVKQNAIPLSLTSISEEKRTDTKKWNMGEDVVVQLLTAMVTRKTTCGHGYNNLNYTEIVE